MYIICSKSSTCTVNKIDEDTQSNYDLNEDATEIRNEARDNGCRFAHLFEKCVDDYDQTYYAYVSTQNL
ncbi:hypothetical protein CN918_29310 [Priestia megaterium]|nr:hypothetical protein CN918_29310 [Priestia megaterium]